MSKSLHQLKDSWRYLSGHPGFRRKPLLTVFRLFTWRARCLLGLPATVDLPKWGARFFLPAKWRGAGTTAIFAMRENYETELICLQRFISPGDFVVDGGANCGIYTIAVSKIVGEAGRVFSFEPGAESFSVLKRNIEINRAHNVRAFPMALSDREGEARLYQYRHGPNSFSLAPEEGGTDGSEEVLTTTVDKVMAQHSVDRVSLIKLDVEGAEELALRGARSMLQSARPTVIFEINSGAAPRLGLSATGAWELLESFGYKFYVVNEAASLSQLCAPPSDSSNVIAIYPRRAA